jgi:hypothetical protein
MYETSILILFRLLPFTEDVFLFKWGILMYLFIVIKLLSLLFMCVTFLYCVSFHIHNTGAIFFRKSCHLKKLHGKMCRVGQARDENKIPRIRGLC